MASTEEVKKLAALARLTIPKEKLEMRAAEFDRIVAYIGQLEELDIRTDAPPTVPQLHNVFREDGEPTPAKTWTEKLVGIFPKRDGNYLSVKKIISHD